MPHQVVKAAVRGSVGDLARITQALEAAGLNIVAIGGGETPIQPGHIGIVAFLLSPDKDRIPEILETVRNVVLDPQTNRRPEDVAAFPDVHILLNDTPGQLRRATEALEGINIETVISVDKQPGNRARVSLGFKDEQTLNQAIQRLQAANIQIHTHPH
jgi:acetolactate synthase small subunit